MSELECVRALHKEVLSTLSHKGPSNNDGCTKGNDDTSLRLIPEEKDGNCDTKYGTLIARRAAVVRRLVFPQEHPVVSR